MNVIEQIKNSASQLFETLEEGWSLLVAKSGQGLTRFTRNRSADEPGDDVVDGERHRESWGILAGEIAETESDLIVRLEAPGMEKTDFDIRVENGMLRILGEKRFARERHNLQGANYHLFEAAYGSFERALALPREVDADRAEASYRGGVLTVRLPKVAVSNARTITVD